MPRGWLARLLRVEETGIGPFLTVLQNAQLKDRLK